MRVPFDESLKSVRKGDVHLPREEPSRQNIKYRIPETEAFLVKDLCFYSE